MKIRGIARSLLGVKYADEQKKWEKMFLFGLNDGSMYVFNLFVTTAKYVIWLRRNMAKYETVDYFENRMEITVRLLWNYFLMEDKEEKFMGMTLNGNPMIEYKVHY